MAWVPDSDSDYKFIFDIRSRDRMWSKGHMLSKVSDPAQQWDISLILLSDEELQKITPDFNRFEPHVMTHVILNIGMQKVLLLWLRKMKVMFTGRITNEDTPKKSDHVAEYWRLKGNTEFGTDFNEDSLAAYNKSLRYAVPGGPMYPLALGNRSAVLYRLHKYKECLQDIDRALDSGYPENMWHKLYLRRANCYANMNDNENALAHLEAAINQAAKANIKGGHAEDFESQMNWVLSKLESGNAYEDDEEVVLPEMYKGENPNFVNASGAVTLQRNDEVGRHVVTTEATHRGDVLFSEEPYAWVTINPEKDDLCETCCNRNSVSNFVPCETCSRAVFCSEDCRDRGMELFHNWECVGIQSQIFQTIGISHLSLRVLFTAAHEGFPPLPPGHPKPYTAQDVFHGYSRVDPVEIYKPGSPRFYRMFNLVTNIEKIDPRDYWQYAVTAYALLLYLEKFTTFFDYLPTRVPYQLPEGQLRLLVASLLLRSICQLICNGHATTGILVAKEEFSETLSEQEMRRATALYLSSAMMNHACNPNIINTFYGNRLIIRCARELTAGAEIFNCYGPHRARKSAVTRRETLRAQYGFHCMCGDCTDSQNDIVVLYNAYACQTCKNPAMWDGNTTSCIQCHTLFPLERASRLLDRAEQMELKSTREPSLAHQAEMEFQALRLRQQVLHRHNIQLRNSMDRLAHICAELKDYNRSVELIKQNVQTLECQFGSFSAEVANELRKLSGVMVMRLQDSEHNPEFREWCLETYKVVKKAYQLSELNHGAWQPMVKKLRLREKYVAAIVAQQRAADAAEDLENVHHNLHYNLKI